MNTIEKISKTQIRKIGQSIRENLISENELNIFNAYRNIYIEVMEYFVNSIKDKLPKPLFIARRLKRLESIKIKLQRFPQMELDRIQDIGGTRAVFKNLNEVKEYIKNIKQINDIPFKLIKENNYISNPKDDGYRSYHLIFECLLENLKGYKVELQIRDLKQHYWATAIEILALINQNNNIKIGKAEEFYKKFFFLSSKLLHNEINSIEIDELKRLNKEYKILDILKGFSLAFNHIDTAIENLIYIIYIDYIEKTVNINPFHKNNIKVASILYKELEKQNNINAVLIDTSDIKNLELAYPNYFGDAREFIKIIEIFI